MWNVAVSWPWALITDHLSLSLVLSFTVKASQPEPDCTHNPLLQAPVPRHRKQKQALPMTHTQTHTHCCCSRCSTWSCLCWLWSIHTKPPTHSFHYVSALVYLMRNYNENELKRNTTMWCYWTSPLKQAAELMFNRYHYVDMDVKQPVLISSTLADDWASWIQRGRTWDAVESSRRNP